MPKSWKRLTRRAKPPDQDLLPAAHTLMAKSGLQRRKQIHALRRRAYLLEDARLDAPVKFVQTLRTAVTLPEADVSALRNTGLATSR